MKIRLLSLICVLFIGCAMPHKITVPMYPSVMGEEKSTLIVSNAFNPSQFSTNNLSIAVYIDGFRITAKEVLPKGITTIDIAEGNHQITIKAFPKPGIRLTLQDTVLEFDGEAGNTYKLSILPSGKIMDIGYKLTYEGFDKDIMAEWPESNFSRSV